MRFDLTDLALFLHVVQAGSITHGAARANLALAAASARIRNLEASLGAAAAGTRPPRRHAHAGRPETGLARAPDAGARRPSACDDLSGYAGEFGGSVRVLSTPTR